MPASARGADRARRSDNRPSATLGGSASAKLDLPPDAASTGGGHHATRQLINKERKARQAFLTQETQEFATLSRQCDGAMAIIDAFRTFHEQNTLVARRRRLARAQWASATLAEELDRLVASEAAQRLQLGDRHDELWRTIVHLFHTEGQPLFAERARTLLFEAEEARREFLYREEVTAGLLLPLPGYQPLYVGSLRHGAAAMSAKVDFMATQTCPFRFGEHCPYFPKSVLKRGSAARQMELTEHVARSDHRTCHHEWIDRRHTRGASKSALALREAAAHQCAQSPSCECAAALLSTSGVAAGGELCPLPGDRARVAGTAPHKPQHRRNPRLPPTNVKLPAVAADGHVQMSTYAFLSKPHYQSSESCLTKGGQGRM